VTSQEPTRFENYPPDEGGMQRDVPDDRAPYPAPVVRAYNPPPPPPPSGSSAGRRTFIGALIFVPAVGLISLGIGNAEDTAAPTGFATAWDPANPPTADASTDATRQITVGGRYAVTVPQGWEYASDGGGGVEFTIGANRLSASSIEVPPSTLATEELAVLARSHHAGFTGKIGKPADRSTADVQRARMTGTGKFHGKAATLLAELWIDEGGSGLLTTRILTVKPTSEIGVAAQGMVDELSTNF
jgi:hypothetical protein